MKKQVERSHYEFARYVHKRRWASMWHQVDEVTKLRPSRVLEVGPGPGLFKALMSALGVQVETLDVDADLNPDHVASVFAMPFANDTYDVVCAFQMLEHVPFEDSLRAFKEMARVARVAMVISLPDAATRWPVIVQVPKIGQIAFSVPRPRLRPQVHVFNGEHYWEIGKRGYSVERVVEELSNASNFSLTKTFRVVEHPYHRFFVFAGPC